MRAVARDQRLEQELPPPPGLHRRAGAIFHDLASYVGQPLEAITREYWRYRASDDVIAQERVAQAKDETAVVAYYQTTPHYLYELSYWEASHDKAIWLQVLASACRKYGLTRVLDYGGGVGGTCLYLASRGIQCAYVDVQGKTFEYAKWRFQRSGFNIPMFNVLDGWPSTQYDAVITWDVLEHLFDLEGALRGIAGLIRKGGWFLSKSTFAPVQGHHLHIHLAKHACYQDIVRFNHLLEGVGFRFIGQLKPNRFSRALRVLGYRSAVAGVRISPRLKHGGNFLVHECVAD